MPRLPLIPIFLLFLLNGLIDGFQCPQSNSGKIPQKCNKCFELITKQIIQKTTILDKKVMWGFAMEIGNVTLNWVKQRVAKGDKSVPSMCEIGTLVSDYATDNLDSLISCVSQYNAPTAGKVAADATAAMLYCAMNGINIQDLANGLTCAVLECLKGPYKNQFSPKYKKWVKNLNKTMIQNNVCALCVQYLQKPALVQKCFNSAKARTTVKVLQNLYDKYIPNYAAKYQFYRDKSLVACQTRPITCGCNIDVTEAVNGAMG